MLSIIYDEHLLELARGGDKEAILSLLTPAQPDIRRFATYACENSDDVRDAVQKTLWLLYRRVGTLRAITSLPGWLYTIVRRECSRLARKMFGQETGLDVADELPREPARPLQELRIDLARAIQSLREHSREVILLRDIEEMTIEEIAATLGRTREAVKGNLHRARLLLREYLRA